MTNTLSKPLTRWTALVLFALLLFTIKIGERGLSGSQEARTGIIVRGMLETGDFLKPRYYGEDTNQKPIFYYWTTALTSLPAGVNETRSLS